MFGIYVRSIKQWKLRFDPLRRKGIILYFILGNREKRALVTKSLRWLLLFQAKWLYTAHNMFQSFAGKSIVFTSPQLNCNDPK